jgi:hypothetical protein
MSKGPSTKRQQAQIISAFFDPTKYGMAPTKLDNAKMYVLGFTYQLCDIVSQCDVPREVEVWRQQAQS